jgi:thiamine biosynthesis lipoprotein
MTGRRVFLLAAGLVLLVALTLQRLLAPAGPMVHEFAGPTMGTTWTLKLWGAQLSGAEAAALADSAAGRMDEVNRLMSTYDSTSELSRFNAARSTEAMALSPATLEVVATALRVSRETGGALDITVAPLVDAWGFGPAGRPATVPAGSTLAKLATRIGYQRLRLDQAAGTLAKGTPDMAIDLSAVAKGYAVDRAAAVLLEAGVGDFLMEIGGELRASGTRPDGRAWRVAVERPADSSRTIHQVVELGAAAVATSGDYRNFYVRGGRRYAHLIDPRTSAPVTHAGASVTVVAPDCATADAWATALSVLGPQDGFALADSAGIAALFVWQTEAGFDSRATAAFSDAVRVTDP